MCGVLEMSTNYYFELKDSVKKKYQALADKGFIFYEDLHIGKRSYGSKPIFQKTENYSSVDEIIDFYNSNKKYINIIDEYGRIMTFEDLKNNLINWNKGIKSNYYCEMEDAYYDNKGYLFIKTEFC